MASLKYRCLTPNVEVKEYPVAASQIFYHNGAQFCYLDSSGNVTVGVTATTTVLGFALVPKGRGAGASDSYWKSSATAAADKIAVIVDPNAEFLVPLDDSMDKTDIGKGCDIVLTTADGSGPQLIDLDTGSNDIVRITALGTTCQEGLATDAVVKIYAFQLD